MNENSKRMDVVIKLIIISINELSGKTESNIRRKSDKKIAQQLAYALAVIADMDDVES